MKHTAGVVPYPQGCTGPFFTVWLLLAGAAGCSEAPPPVAFEVTEASIGELGAAMEEGRVTSEQLVEKYLARIAAFDDRGPALNAIIVQNPEAVATARALDAERAATGARGPLHGVPILIKDNYDMAGLPTTNGSIAMADVMPPDDAFQVRRLREAGAVMLGNWCGRIRKTSRSRASSTRRLPICAGSAPRSRKWRSTGWPSCSTATSC